jgi:hypothetical protein
MTDRELLERAAKAAGIDAIVVNDQVDDDGLFMPRDRTPDNMKWWNPLRSDGDALRLAVKLRIDVAHFTTGVRADVTGYDDCYQANDADPYAATRRAIVRAAAAMVKE